MITSNILQRVFRLRAGEGTSSGTGFAIPWKGQSYMVTARHVFEGTPLEKFDIFRNGTWDTIVSPVITGGGQHDIAVSRIPETRPNLCVTLSEKGAILSEDVFMVGFPLDFFFEDVSEGAGLNYQFPLPLVSKGCLATVPGIGSPVEGGMIISGQIDGGYSGGPIVLARNPFRPVIIGVISHNLRYRAEETFEDGNRMVVSHPANLVVGYAISIVTNLIDAHFGV